MARLTRREFLHWSAVSSATLVISSGLVSCSSSDDETPSQTGQFTHGIASGDPQPDRVIIWTRATPLSVSDEDSTEEVLPVAVDWQVSLDESFATLSHSGRAFVHADTDYTLKIDVQNLEAGTDYFYRFTSGTESTATGRIRTLPQGTVNSVKFAVVSCSNYPAGYFHPYAEAANETELDAVIHLGDYIYEYGADGYATEDAVKLGRTLAPDNAEEILTLDDYRKRYQLYRSDADLQALHAAAPFIAVWDDHEVTNDSWREGAENHNEGEGDYTERKQQALQAYFEWMPIRPASAGDVETIYRQFQYGDLVNLMMLDTRIIGRDEQLDYANYTDAATGAFNVAEFTADITDANRTLLGAEQLSWLQTQITGSSATWQVLGQQVLMGRMNIPAEVLFSPTDPTVLGEIVAIKGRQLQGDPTLTQEELSRLALSVPYNLDAWDGYAAEREAILATVSAQDKNLVVIAGDTHNAWANNLADINGNPVGVEFATASVTSPGLEDFFGLSDVPASQQTEAALQLLIDGLEYLNANQRGYMVLTFSATEARSDWRFVDTIKSLDYVVDSDRTMSLTMLPGSGNRVITT